MIGRLNHIAIAGNDFSGFNDNRIAFAQSRGRDDFFALAVAQTSRVGFLAHLAEGCRLGLAAPFSDCLGKVRKNHGKPEPETNIERPPQRLRAWRGRNHVA